MNHSSRFQLAIILIFSAAVLAFSPSLNHSFVWDDHLYITDRQHITPPTLKNLISGNHPISTNPVYRPLRDLQYPLFYAFFAANPLPYHLYTILLHATISVLVLLFFTRLKLPPTAAFLGALVFALHPIHTEAVAWITAGFDLIYALFYLLALLFYLHPRRQPTQLRLALLFTLLACLSNELAYTLPLVLIALDHFILRQPIIARLKHHRYTPYFALAGLSLLLRIYFSGSVADSSLVLHSFLDYLLLPFFLLGRYLSLFLFPLSLTPDHLLASNLTGIFFQNHNPLTPAPSLSLTQPQVLLPLLLTAGYFACLYWLRRRSRPAFFLAFIGLTLLPILQIIPQAIIFAERYSYLSLAGFAGLLGLFAYHLITVYPSTKPLATLAIAAYLATLGAKTLTQTQIWRQDLTLWQHALTHNPHSAIAHSTLGKHYFDQTQYSKALTHFSTAFQQNPSRRTYQDNLIATQNKLQLYTQAISTYQQLIRLYPQNPRYLLGLARHYQTRLQKPDQALNYYRQALQLDPQNRHVQTQIQALTDETP